MGRGHEPLDKSEIRNPKSEIEQSVLPPSQDFGATSTSAPTGSQEEPLRLVMKVSGDLTPHADAGGQRLELRDASGSTVLSYEKLKVWDATGVELPATMETSECQVTLSVKDATARYPLIIDPTFTQQAKLTASDAQRHDEFGGSVAISGDIIVVGADREVGGAGPPVPDAGAAYVFARNQGGPNQWGEVKKLTASDTQPFDEFGYSVAISGDIIVVGADREDGGAGHPVPDAGAAYVFARNQGGPNQWGEVKKLTASDAQTFDAFGSSVAIGGDLIVVGALSEIYVPGNFVLVSGAAYVFARDQGGPNQWGEVKKLTASDAQGRLLKRAIR